MKQLTLAYQVGRYLRLRMKLANVNVYQVAKRLMVSPTLILRVIAGQEMPRFAEIELVSSCIDTDARMVLRTAWAMCDAWELEKGRFDA